MTKNHPGQSKAEVHRNVAILIDLGWFTQHHLAVYTGAQRFAREHGDWSCTVAPYPDEGLKFPGTGQRYSGIIARVTPSLAERAEQAGIPLVNVYFNSKVKDAVTVSPDQEAAGRMAAEHLLARGFNAFAYLGFRRSRTSKLQLAGFRAVLKVEGGGATCSEHLISQSFDQGEQRWHTFQEGLDRHIRSWPRQIGVFVTADLVCRYVAQNCQRLGLNIPNDVGLVGVENEPAACMHADPTLTSIDMAYEKVGYEAAMTLDRMMDGGMPSSNSILIPPDGLVARGSTDLFMVPDPLVSCAMRFMAENAHRGIGIRDIAAHVHTGRRTLERRFSDALGRTLGQEFTRLKIERVKRELTHTDDAVKTIAVRTGFLDGKQLGKTFKRVVGITPREYRNQRKPD